MRWHYENRRPPGVMCHPSDGEAWKHFDRTYPDFANEGSWGFDNAYPLYNSTACLSVSYSKRLILRKGSPERARVHQFGVRLGQVLPMKHILEEWRSTYKKKGCNEQGEPYKPSNEEECSIWLGVCGGVHKGRAYGLSSERSFHRLDSGLRGIGTSSDAEGLDRDKLESMQQKIAMLNEELQAAAAAREADRVAREAERVRLDDDMASLKSQMKHFVRNVLLHSDESDED